MSEVSDNTIQAPAERVWQAWANAAELSVWFTTKAEQDFREGGAYGNADGDKGIFEEIVPPRRLRFSWDNEKHSPGTFVTVELKPDEEGKTRIFLTHEKLADQDCADDMRKGWTWALTSLKSYLETGKPITYDEWERQNMDQTG